MARTKPNQCTVGHTGINACGEDKDLAFGPSSMKQESPGFSHGECQTHKRTLTVAHLNHTPEDCRRKNLRALCAPCHLRYDAAHHAETRAKRQPMIG